MKRTFLLLLSFTLLLGLSRTGTAAGVQTPALADKNIMPPSAADTFWKGVHTVQLDNGLTVLLKEDHAQPVVSVQVWVKVGSVNENSRTSGLSHFLEHLIFKGTEKYPGDEISRQVETQGGVINAATSKEFTQFYIDIQETGYRNAIRILADAMANAAFPAAEIERERPVVIEEIHRHEDNPGSLLYDYYNEAVFPHSPYRASIIGSDEVIRTVSRDDIAAYYHAHYIPSNMFVTLAGDINTDEALALVKETFGTQKAEPASPAPNLIEPLHKASSISRNKDVEHAYWLGGFVGPDAKSDDQFTADITATILGGGRSSRLFRQLREEKQLVYAISSSFWSQRGSGAFAVSAIFGTQKAEPASPAPNLIESLHEASSISRNKDVEHAYWLGGFVGPDAKSDDQFTADITATILGGGRSSRLFRQLREEKQLVYAISSSFWSQRGSGAFAVSAIFDPKNEKQVLSGINAEIRRLMEKGPDDAELRRAKEMIKAQWFFGLETYHEQASIAGYWNMQGNPGILERYIPELEKVRRDDVMQFLKKYYETQGMSGALMLPQK
jgi:predicted Zn-dependent peptidase